MIANKPMWNLARVLTLAITVAWVTPSLGQNKTHFPFSPPIPPTKTVAAGHESYQNFAFTDKSGKVWIAPKGTITDGASIPQIALSFVGDRYDKQYFGAALIHDAYCAQDNKNGISYHKASWRAVHRMFYEACLAGGTPEPKATIMYAAIQMFGPRNWAFTKTPCKTCNSISALSIEEMEILSLDLSSASDSQRAEQFAEVIGFIKTQAPDSLTLEKTLREATLMLSRGRVLKLSESIKY